MAKKPEQTAAPGAAQQYPPMILEARIHSIKPSGYLRATASVNMNGCFAVKNIKIMDGQNGLYVEMPSYVNQSTGKYKEHCFPVTTEFREQLHGAVMNAYHQALTTSHESALANRPQPEAEVLPEPASMEDEPEPEVEQGTGMGGMAM